MDLYNKVCFRTSRIITASYSTSFTLGIKTLHPKLHEPIYAIYGFVRLADEIVDTFHEYNKGELLNEFRSETYKAIQTGISTNPVLQAFQIVVRQYNISQDLIDSFLKSMEMDLYKNAHQASSYNEYIYGSAEAVGLMCLQVFCNGDAKAYESLKEPAQKLGAAFQKVNFLRDMKSDYDERGRVYFPGVDFTGFNDEIKKRIEEEIESDFNAALDGIRRLPTEAKFGVYVAYIYYRALMRRISRLPASDIRKIRVRVPNREKFALLFTSWFRFRLNFL